MRTRPLALLLFCMSMMVVTMSLPIQVLYSQNFENMFQMLTWLNIFIMLLCAITSLAVFNLHKSFRYLLPIVLVAVIFNNWWVGYVGFNFNFLQTSLASLGFLGLYCFLLEKNTYKVLCNPKLKWWDASLRSKIEIPVLLSPFLSGVDLAKKSFDISESGFFLQGLESEELERLSLGQKFSVCFNFSRILKIRCTAKLVRKCGASGIYPAGIGLQFEGLDAQVRSAIKRLSQERNEAFL